MPKLRKLTRKQIVLAICLALVAVLTVAYFQTKPYTNRWLDNRDRAVMARHGLLIQQKIQALADKNGAYPSSDEVKRIIDTSGFINPHTNAPYVFAGPVVDTFPKMLGDGKITYSIGDYWNNDPTANYASFCMGIPLPRVSEGGEDCIALSITPETDARIKYQLSCKINWLGFYNGCDKSLLH